MTLDDNDIIGYLGYLSAEEIARLVERACDTWEKVRDVQTELGRLMFPPEPTP